ncbi:hypothetical protein GUITHDRAFT_98616 [Guillardia theta CCMP2712]|uniref:4-hydroxy-4-methyl-2-oxoglutarate aldolase n=2 Tax=Guillardia theta TaxID=55529 RepID=L1I940_GUITC|nr:hypothetical protein GUITHDRAFT_98616 [Guillardia theta CCMP2712]EKX32355.1 hypothetical protein GUITHDRAFT_98616 [Guillardia theta CCMP2712]|eukprot:XP_005819335.1 hypothetical protein GUITHDRAFT_98616 [Guillardia theta CCMP2712]
MNALKHGTRSFFSPSCFKGMQLATQLSSRSSFYTRAPSQQFAPRAFLSSFATADICDSYGLDVSKISSDHGVKVIDPSLNFKNFGGQSEFCGSIVTIKAYESNPLVRATLQEDGNGRVLVVDAGGSTRCAMLGGNLAEIGEKNGWAGIVVYGCIRDSKEISNICIGVKALNTHPVKSHKDEKGVRDVPLHFGGVTIRPGDYMYSDSDGILIMPGPVK